ncbi:RimJ/RimL family protein N-acetyltransferase [Amycolatopsis bartoniae]|nr:GNAT family N-acetyltransferase [Amycolatopsis bartoniae]MBB2939255.1 RimJ/RimL family protein N-acetyltransferase [Amycolatopsis bartoniae]TVT09549.1 GNAT family N-acetyltransferase [Amycolatopsis bartoniae]
MIEPATELTDGVVLLRRWRADDLEPLLHVVQDSLAHLEPFMPWAVGGYSQDDGVRFLRDAERQWSAGEAFDYANVGADGEILGAASLMTRLGPGAFEIGYWIGRRHTGHGLVTRAAALLTTEAFRLGRERVEIRHDQANVRSGLVPQRLGFTRSGTAPAELPGGTASTGVHVHWRMTAEVWASRDSGAAGTVPGAAGRGR